MQLAISSFADDAIPEVVIDREKEQEFVASHLKDVLSRTRRTVYVYGVPGVGKTTVAKHVSNAFEQEYGNATVCYICCSGLTPTECMKAIYRKALGERRRPSTMSVMSEEIAGRLARKKHSIVIILDNLDKLYDAEKLLWQISNLIDGLAKVGLVMIATSRFELEDFMGSQLRSRLSPIAYEFKPYNAERIREILASKIRHAYGRNVISGEAIGKLSNFVAETSGSARHALKIFYNATLLAEGEKMITSEVLEKVLENERMSILAIKVKLIKEKTPREFEVLRLIAELCLQNAVVTTGMLKDSIRKTGLAAYGRMLDYYLNHLQDQALIAMKEKRERGLTREIKSCLPAELVLN